MEMTEDIMDALRAECAILYDDGIVQKCIFARERGEERGNPHIGGHLLISIKETEPLKVSAKVKKIFRKVLLAVVDGKLPRLSVKTNALRDWMYYVGYDDKARLPSHAPASVSRLCALQSERASRRAPGAAPTRLARA